MNQQMTLDNFNLLSTIGKGSYAKVILVKRKDDDSRVYAMKILKKKFIQKRKQENHVMIERNILVEVDHPFIVKLYYSFQNENKLFFALEYCPGGELFGLLSKKHRFSEDQTKFYAAQIILALEYLHNKDIIYRDLKPQNILIDAQGYIRLTDFGLSRVQIKEDNQAMSVCGTPEYLAPEILYKQGHGKPVDWWCLGSVIFEMMVGLPPFFSKNRTQLFDKIKFGNPNMPIYLSMKLRNLLEGLFQKKPENRLGTNGANQIKKHPWFENVDWEALENKKIGAPFVPKVKSQTDVSNFDTEFTECPVQSCSQASMKSDEGKPYFGFSFQGSKEDKMDIQEGLTDKNAQFQLNMDENQMMTENPPTDNHQMVEQ